MKKKKPWFNQGFFFYISVRLKLKILQNKFDISHFVQNDRKIAFYERAGGDDGIFRFNTTSPRGVGDMRKDGMWDESKG